MLTVLDIKRRQWREVKKISAKTNNEALTEKNIVSEIRLNTFFVVDLMNRHFIFVRFNFFCEHYFLLRNWVVCQRFCDIFAPTAQKIAKSQANNPISEQKVMSHRKK